MLQKSFILSTRKIPDLSKLYKKSVEDQRRTSPKFSTENHSFRCEERQVMTNVKIP